MKKYVDSKYIEIEHVGDILREEFMEPLDISMNALAAGIGVPTNRIHGIVHRTRGITADTDLRLTKFFGLSQGYFLRLQEHYDMLIASREIKDEIDAIIPFDYKSRDSGTRRPHA
ncbi:MAG: HigA family addiction module antidote protein [Rickettsiales bacterium]|jgi:addiction module HigA family antidote|nr:HigA family addiction module antidote protein [Rickettsiales bacterium]